MATLILSSLMGNTGAQLLGPVGQFLGAEAGMFMGSQIDQFLLGIQDVQHNKYGPRINPENLYPGTQGRIIPISYGKTKISGQIIWNSPIKETTTTTQDVQNISKSSPRIVTNNTAFEYYASFAVAICKGPIDTVLNVWINDVLIDKSKIRYRIFQGNETQEPDYLIESIEGKSPAYRGLAYIVIENLPLHEYNNRIPLFSFEVQKILTSQITHRIKSLVLIPGSGEFVYDTLVKTKTPALKVGNTLLPTGKSERINQNTNYNTSDALIALNQIQATLPNLQWISVVVNWFANSLDIADIMIYPAVEYKGDIISSWKVKNWTRETAIQITSDGSGNPIYGGTPDDDSVINCIKKLKEMGYKVCIYPILLINMIEKPWRGHITGDSLYVQQFFEQYKVFIKHYAQSCKEFIDAIIIGSELKALTSIKQQETYPAVQELVQLASEIKSIVGSETTVTYAADWSEYHSSEGNYNLDPLWTDENIDVVGIDAYFPITDSPQPERGFSVEDIIKGWESGYGFDYFYKPDGTKINFTDSRYSWKNIRYWWENIHTNPDSTNTEWKPKMKPIWFTEYGFPSINGCSNQPNVFIDNLSTESRLPKYSTGSVDFNAQNIAIRGTLDKWQNSDMVTNMFLWTWDARPFPFFPDRTDLWKDHQSWITGHWVQGKISTNSLGAILYDIMIQSGFEQEEFDTSQLTDAVGGYILLNQQSLKNIIEVLQKAFFFDISEDDGKIIFRPRRYKEPETIKIEEMIEPYEVRRTEELDLPSSIRLNYIDQLDNYQINTAHSFVMPNQAYTTNKYTLSLPLVLNHSEAKSIVNINLNQAWGTRNSFRIKLPNKYDTLRVNDLIKIEDRVIRITKIRKGEYLSIEGIQENPSLYHSNNIKPVFLITNLGTKQFPDKTEIRILDLPLINFENCIYIALYSLGKNWRGATLHASNDNARSFQKIASLNYSATAGYTAGLLGIGQHSIFDMHNTLTLALHNGTLETVDELSVLNGNNTAIVGKEIIQFQHAELLSNGQYRISRLLRGLYGTEIHINSHQIGEEFIMINHSITAIPYPIGLIGGLKTFKTTSIGGDGQHTTVDFIYKGNNLKPIGVTHLQHIITGEGDIIMQWVRRARNGGWKDKVDVPLEESEELYEVEISINRKIKRTLRTQKPEVKYTRKMLEQDSTKSNDSLEAVIYKVSTITGRGYPETLKVVI